MTTSGAALFAARSTELSTTLHPPSYPQRRFDRNASPQISYHKPRSARNGFKNELIAYDWPTNVTPRPWVWTRSLTFVIIFSLLLCPFGVHASNESYQLETPVGLLFDHSEHRPLRMHRHSLRDTGLSSAFSTPLPRPFDSNLGSNFTTSSCPAFFETFLNNSTFLDCVPLSLLLQTSNGFFSETRSRIQLTQTLDAACKANYQQCSAIMSSYASQIQSSSNCGADLALRNPVVEEAYNGFVAYQPLYHAGCLRARSSSSSSNTSPSAPQTGDGNGNGNGEAEYCFANAATNLSAPTSSYIYYLPLGMSLPPSTQPSCNACLRDTMAVFAAYAVDSAQPLSGDYAAAAEQVDAACGARFADRGVRTGSTSGAVSIRSGGLGLAVLPLVVGLVLVFFV